jgi:uncharacterized protein YjbI with pentapeptide repeats
MDFRNCQFERANFHQTHWLRADFTEASLDTARPTDPARTQAEKRSLEMEVA